MASRYSCLLEPEPPWKTKKTWTLSARTIGLTQIHRLTRLLVLATELLRDEGLVLAKQLGVETDVAGGVDAVDVTAKPSARGSSGVGGGEFITRNRQRSRSTWRSGGKLARYERGLVSCHAPRGRRNAHLPDILGPIHVSVFLARLLMQFKPELTEYRARHCRPGGSC